MDTFWKCEISFVVVSLLNWEFPPSEIFVKFENHEEIDTPHSPVEVVQKQKGKMPFRTVKNKMIKATWKNKCSVVTNFSFEVHFLLEF